MNKPSSRHFALIPILLGFVSTSTLSLGASATWTGAVDGNWTSVGNWTPSVPGAPTIASSNSDIATFLNAANTTVAVDPTRALGAMLFKAGTGAFTFNSGTFYLASSGGTGTAGTIVLESGVTANQVINTSVQALRTSAAGGFGFTNNSESATLTINGAVRGSMGAGSTTTQLNLDGAGDGVLGGVVSDGLGALSVVKTGLGTWTFSNANTYTGTTTLADGGITLDFSQASSPASNIIASSSLLLMGRGSPSALAGPRTLTIAGKVDTANTQTFNGYALNVGANHLDLSTSGTGSMAVSLGAMAITARVSGVTFDIAMPAGTSATTTTVNSAAGLLPQAFTLNGTDFAANNGSNTIVAFSAYTANTATTLGTTNQVIDMIGGNTTLTGTGQTSISGMRFNTASATTLTLDPARLVAVGNSGSILVTENVGANLTRITGGLLAGISSRDLVILQNNTQGDLQIDSVITSSNNNGLGLTKSGDGKVILTGRNTLGGSANYIHEGTVVVTADATTGNTQSLTTTASSTISGVDTTGLFVGQRVTGTNIPGVSQGLYIVAINAGAGTVTLNGVASAGTGNVIFGNSGGLGTLTGATAVQIGVGASLEIGNGGTTGGLVDGQGIVNNGTVGLNRSNAFTFSNTMSGAGGLTQMGSGTSTVTAVHSYTGNTVVNAGTLLVNGSAVSSAAVVNTGGTLGGSGTVGSLTLNAGGALSPGNGLGMLSTNNGSLVWNGQVTPGFGQMKFDLSTVSNTSDVLNLGTGMFDQGTGGFFVFDFQNSGGDGFTYTLVNFGSTDFTVDDFDYTNLGSGLSGDFVLNSGNLQFVVSVIPEPSTVLLLAGGVGALFGFRRRARA